MAFDNGHGTHVAGTIGAIGNSGQFKEFTVTKKTDTAAVPGGIAIAAGDLDGDPGGDAAAAGGNFFNGRLLTADDMTRESAAASDGEFPYIVSFQDISDAAGERKKVPIDFIKSGSPLDPFEPSFLGGVRVAGDDGADAASGTLLAPKPGPVAYPGPTEVNYGNGNDIIFASDDWEIINGGAGNDVFVAAATAGWFPDLADTWDGGSGLADTASFTNAATAVEVDLLAGTAWRQSGAGWNGPINLVSIENVVGSTHADWIAGTMWENTIWGHDGNDTIYGNDSDDVLYGGLGNDTLHGGWHYDTLYGEDGADTLNGDNADDVLYGGAGNDTLNGGEHNDTLYGEAGADTLIGGSGTDKAVYNTNGDVSVNLATGYASGALGSDTLFSVEDVTTGGGDDTLTGDDARNVLDGNGGHDTLIGGGGNDGLVGRSGNDVLRGGAGDDNLYGGTGADEFRWQVGDLGLDDVDDFVLGEDRVTFGNGFLTSADPADSLLVFSAGSDSLLFADTVEAGLQAIARFNNITSAELTAAINNGVLFGYEVGELGGGAPGGLAGAQTDQDGRAQGGTRNELVNDFVAQDKYVTGLAAEPEALDDIVVGPGTGGGAHVKYFDGRLLTARDTADALDHGVTVLAWARVDGVSPASSGADDLAAWQQNYGATHQASHTGGVNALMGDGSVRFVRDSIDLPGSSGDDLLVGGLTSYDGASADAEAMANNLKQLGLAAHSYDSVF